MSELRGFDAYEVSLGDQMRGERACLGKSLRDVQRDICITARLLEAIENCDVGAFPNRSVVPGYVRSYARYLGMDPDDVYARFCAASGFQSSLATFGMTAQAAAGQDEGARAGMGGAVGADFAASRFAVQPAPRRIGAPVSLGGVMSGLALAGLVGMLGYGGWAVLQDIQRVGFAPLPEAPAVVADAPSIVTPAAATEVEVRPDAGVYGGDGVLASLVPPAALAAPEIARRDGPISAINPRTAGVFAERAADAHPPLADDAAPAPATDAVRRFSESIGPGGLAEGTELAAAMTVETVAPVPVPVDRSVGIVVTERAWLRVRDGSGAVLFEGILSEGDTFDLPERAEGAEIRAGNAGGVMIRVGADTYGPLGRPGAVVKKVSLDADDVIASFPKGAPAAAEEEMRRADARLPD